MYGLLSLFGFFSRSKIVLFNTASAKHVTTLLTFFVPYISLISLFIFSLFLEALNGVFAQYQSQKKSLELIFVIGFKIYKSIFVLLLEF